MTLCVVRRLVFVLSFRGMIVISMLPLLMMTCC